MSNTLIVEAFLSGATVHHRLKAPTQTLSTAVSQRRSQTVHGLPYGHSWGGGGLYPIVKAFAGRLGLRSEGIEFVASAKPNVVFPRGLCYWQKEGASYSDSCLRIQGDRAILSVTMPARSARYACARKGNVR